MWHLRLGSVGWQLKMIDGPERQASPNLHPIDRKLGFGFQQFLNGQPLRVVGESRRFQKRLDQPSDTTSCDVES